VECRDERRTKRETTNTALSPGRKDGPPGGFGEEEKGLEGGVGPLTRISRFCKDKRKEDRQKFERFKTKFKQLNLENLIVVGNKISNKKKIKTL
jgi:hypothetical protein